jgi:hypothetical protein
MDSTEIYISKDPEGFLSGLSKIGGLISIISFIDIILIVIH